MELMNAYETAVQVMQLCQQIKQGGAPVNQGFNQMNQGYGQPQQNMGGFSGNPVQNAAYAAASAQVQSNAYNNAAPVTPQAVDASWICSSCGTRNEGKFCQGCGYAFTLSELRMDSGERSAYAEILPRMRSTLVI